MIIPPDHIVIAAFARGEIRGRLRTKYGRAECPYGESRGYQRDAWFAGYDWGFQQAGHDLVEGVAA